MEDCWGREGKACESWLVFKNSHLKAWDSPFLHAGSQTGMVEGQQGWGEHLTPEFKHKNEDLYHSWINSSARPRQEPSIFTAFWVFLRLKNYSPMFLNACIIFLKWDKALCKPLKVAVPGQWSPHDSALISFSPQLLLAGIPKCPVRWQQTWLAYAAQYGPRLKQPVHNNKLLVFQISTACYSHTGF